MGALFVQPHCDDAVLSSFSLLSRAAGAVVVTVFAGVPGDDVVTRPGGTVPGGMTPRGYMLARRAEDSAVLRSLGAGAVHLDFLELQFRDDPDESGLVDRIEESLDAFVTASTGTVVCPVGIGGNPNHLQVASAVARVAGRHALDVVWCADYPYAADPSWPAWIDGGVEFPHGWSDALAVTGGVTECTVVNLDENTRAAKLSSFLGYATQVHATDGGEERRVTSPLRIRSEVFFNVADLSAPTA